MDSSSSGNGYNGVKIITVAVDSVALFYVRKHQSQDYKKGATLILSTIPRDLITRK